MRQILVDRARHRKALKRGGGLKNITLGDYSVIVNDSDQILAHDDALQKLEKVEKDHPKLLSSVISPVSLLKKLQKCSAFCHQRLNEIGLLLKPGFTENCSKFNLNILLEKTIKIRLHLDLGS